MSTSGQIGGKLTVRDVITTAMELLGTLAPGDDLAGDEAVSGIRYLNYMLKSWQADGCNLWRDEEVEITWPAATAECELSPTVMDVISARYVQSTTYERWLARWERGDYQVLPNKISVGMPTLYVFIKTTGAAKMAIWPVPATQITIKADVARVTEDVTALDQDIDIPQEWLECVYYNLAARMAATMGTHNFPMVVADVNAKAQSLYASLSSFDRPGSYTFQPWGSQ